MLVCYERQSAFSIQSACKLGLQPKMGCFFKRKRVRSCEVIYSQFGLAIHQNDHQARRRFVEWAQNEIAVVPDFHKRILFSDEAHFWLNGYVNKQNGGIWSEANPQVYVETPLHTEKLTVWCALWAGGIIGPYFFKNDEGHNVTVNGDRYRALITNFFIPELNNHDVQELWFQQDSATCHTSRATIDLLKDTFGERQISRFGPVNWPPRSCDLTPLDYVLWGYVKSLIYADKPQALDHFEDNFRRVIADIRPQMLDKVIENWTSRLDYIRASRDSPMPEIIFKICTDVGFVNSSTSAATRIACKGAFIQDPLKANHRRLGLQWSHDHRAWQTDWHQVVFSDELRFHLWGHDGRIHVRRYASEHCLPECVIKRHSDLILGVMVWDAVPYHGRTNLLRIEGNLNNNTYVWEVLQPESPSLPLRHPWSYLSAG
ncbi:DUF4817 domain-containing protein [Trichonephila clavipes]|nr:DUF4817 domain-containing protein [Trichonephila clavipes]